MATSCSGYEPEGVPPGAGSGGTGGTGGAAGDGTGGTGGNGGNAAAGRAGSPSSGGAGGSSTPPLSPALPANAPVLACPAQVRGALAATDARQIGRHARIAPVSACGAAKAYPTTLADPSNPHLFDVYRFSNTSATPACFRFTLTYPGVDPIGEDPAADAGVADGGLVDGGVVDGGVVDGSYDASTPELEADAGEPAAGGGGAPGVVPAKFMAAYGTFYPTNLARGFQGDVGDALTSPQTMAITVQGRSTVDVVIYAIDVAPAGAGSYALSCATE